MATITQTISRVLEKHRIVFWHDAKNELRGEYQALALPGVEKIEIGIAGTKKLTSHKASHGVSLVGRIRSISL